MKTILGLSVYLLLLACAYYAGATMEDWTDTGVGCLDDCLDPMIQDEAQTIISQRRN